MHIPQSQGMLLMMQIFPPDIQSTSTLLVAFHKFDLQSLEESRTGVTSFCFFIEHVGTKQ